MVAKAITRIAWLVFILIIDYGESSYSDITYHRRVGKTTDNFHVPEPYPHQARQFSSVKSPFRINPIVVPSSSRVYHVTEYGADPTGKEDSTGAVEKAMREAVYGHGSESGQQLFSGIHDLGGSQLHLDGGTYRISRPLRLPRLRVGNFMIHGGSLRASENFPSDGHVIELWSPTTSPDSISYEDISIKDIMIDANFRGGGISVSNALRTIIDNCYISHFTTNGIYIQDGHETFIRNSFIGQRITVGGDPREKDFSGIGIKIVGNDNAVTDAVIFSASVGVMIIGQANVLTGIHFYNKDAQLGGTGVYIKQPGLTQARITNCYFDYTGIIAEDPVQLQIADSFFLGNARVVIKSLDGVVCQVSIVDNMFTGDWTGAPIVELDEAKSAFKIIEQVVVERNIVRGMNLKSTIAKGLTSGKGTIWNVDLSDVLLFPNRIQDVRYTFQQGGGSFPIHVLRNVSENRVTIESNMHVSATVYVYVDQNSY
ncbi:polygalacturonase QRT3-like [Euphorbia lathyris]|uniref:polygalacturonase QRT3-like n=1 Tax=Euphorbia lathyris TaxID=212925 RepID=UPI00331319E8